MFRRLLLLNGIAILAVILFHSAGWGFTAMFSWSHRYLPAGTPVYSQYGSLSYYALRVIEQLIVFAIPAFLFVSGVFIAISTGRAQSPFNWKLVGIRIRDLVIPYLLWSGLLLLLFALEGKVFSASGYLRLLATGATNPAYYYVPLLCQFYLLAPFLVVLARRRWLPLLVVTGMVQLAVQALYYPALLHLDIPAVQPFVDVVPKWFFPARIFWFTLGIVAGFNLSYLEKSLPRIKWGLLAAVILLVPLGVIEWETLLRASGQEWVEHRETILDSLYAVSVIFCFLAFNKVTIPFSKRIDAVGSKSFGIYLVHSPVMEVVSRGVYHVAPWLLASQFFFQPLLVVLGLGVPLLLMGAANVNRSPIRRYYKYSFG